MSISREVLKSAPVTSGVYMFRNGTTPLYIGKAVNIKKRLASYFRKNILGKIVELQREANNLDWIETTSEVEALIREALLIKAHLPKYNILMRDDKNYFYVGITREDYPKLFITHQPRMQSVAAKKRKLSIQNSKFKIHDSDFIGPFTSGSALRATLRILRRIFPYCTCFTPHKRPCLNSQIGRCKGYCCTITMNTESLATKSQKEEYKKNIKSIVAILGGKRKKLLAELKREMRGAVKNEKFERAAELRDAIFGLENIFEHKTILEDRRYKSDRAQKIQLRRSRWTKIEHTIQTLLNIESPITRVEGYDISNISGASATGSMVVFRNGIPEKSEYRKFKIKTIHKISDVDMHKEVMRRRLMHAEWPYPELMVIDGGKPQLNAILSVASNANIKIVGLAKREEELYIEGRKDPVRLDSLPQDTMFFFQNVRNESHRFAKKYHHKLREISYRQ